METTTWGFESIIRGMIGIVSIIAIAWAFSINRKAVNWRVVGTGLLIQLVLALSVLYVPFVGTFFEIVGKMFVKVLDFTKAGSSFLLGDLVDLSKTPYIFLFQILPTIIFFSALSSLLFYLGIIQKVVVAIAWALKKALGVSGAEGLTVSANIFVGQTEAPLLTKKYLAGMTPSEIFLVMVGGMATIAGGVMAAYVGMLGGADPVARLFYAKHLLSASVMAAPAAIVLAKILVPQTEEFNSTLEVEKSAAGNNILGAIADGTIEGVRLAANIGAMILVFIAMMAMLNYLLSGVIGRFTGLNNVVAGWTDGESVFSLEFLLGLLFSPLSWLMGVCSADIGHVGQLLGKKIIINEFVGYADLSALKQAGVFAQNKSVVIATYMMCGFANISSVGICIGGIGSLAPSQRSRLTRFGFRALLGGALASCLSATIVGMLM